MITSSYSISIRFPFCPSAQENQKKNGTCLRVSLFVLGIIAITLGILILRQVSVFSRFTSTAGGGLCFCGALLIGSSMIRLNKELSILPSNRLDPSIPANACKLLNVPENRMRDTNFVRERYEKINDALAQRIERLGSNEPFVIAIKKILEDAKKAQETLLNLS